MNDEHVRLMYQEEEEIARDRWETRDMKRQILVIEDNADIGNLLRMHLSDAGYEVTLRNNGLHGLETVLQESFDLLVLDLMLPGLDGLDVCMRLRAQGRYLPILMLTSKSSEVDRVVGLEMGADDYLTKPFSIPELLARVKAILRRVEVLRANPIAQLPEVIHAGDVRLDCTRRSVMRGDESVDLTAKEFDLLAYLMRHRGRVYTRAQLLDQVWGYAHAGYEHTVNSHINRLRAKIERQPERPEYVLTVWGVGYKFAEGSV